MMAIIMRMPIAATTGETTTTTKFLALRCCCESKNLLSASPIAQITTTQRMSETDQNALNAVTHSVGGSIGIAANTYNATTIHVPNAGTRSQPIGNTVAPFNSVMANVRGEKRERATLGQRLF